MHSPAPTKPGKVERSTFAGCTDFLHAKESLCWARDISHTSISSKQSHHPRLLRFFIWLRAVSLSASNRMTVQRMRWEAADTSTSRHLFNVRAGEAIPTRERHHSSRRRYGVPTPESCLGAFPEAHPYPMATSLTMSDLGMFLHFIQLQATNTQSAALMHCMPRPDRHMFT